MKIDSKVQEEQSIVDEASETISDGSERLSHLVSETVSGISSSFSLSLERSLALRSECIQKNKRNITTIQCTVILYYHFQWCQNQLRYPEVHLVRQNLSLRQRRK